MEEIRRISDRISVLRDGRLVATRATAEFPLDEIVRLMVGRELGGDPAGFAPVRRVKWPCAWKGCGGTGGARGVASRLAGARSWALPG